MTSRNASGEAFTGVTENVSGERSIAHATGALRADKSALADYSLSSPAMRQALKRDVVQAAEGHSPIIVADNKAPLHAGDPQQVSPTTNLNKGRNNQNRKNHRTEPTVPVVPAAELHDLNRGVDPCSKTVTLNIAPADLPKQMDRVQDKDPELYARIKDKVKDPRYIGQVGDITEATHDKKGHVNGCVFIQNTPYWESAAAAKDWLSAKADLAGKGKEVEADTLNGAGRTFGQEEAIAYRNTGVHAKPGRSNHGFGRAIDLKPRPDGQVQPSDDPEIREALHAHGWRQGDSHGPIKNDLHHWSYAGPGKATEGHEEEAPPKHHRRHHR